MNWGPQGEHWEYWEYWGVTDRKVTQLPPGVSPVSPGVPGVTHADPSITFGLGLSHAGVALHLRRAALPKGAQVILLVVHVLEGVADHGDAHVHQVGRGHAENLIRELLPVLVDLLCDAGDGDGHPVAGVNLLTAHGQRQRVQGDPDTTMASLGPQVKNIAAGEGRGSMGIDGDQSGSTGIDRGQSATAAPIPAAPALATSALAR